MNHKSMFLAVLLALSILAAPVFLATDTATAATLEEAIASTPQGTEKGQINPDAPKGYLGIPGGPQINPVLAFCWAMWVGWVFSTVGAFGGVLAGVGHISIFGLGDYAKTFPKGSGDSPTLNNFVTDSIRVSNQWLVGTSGLVSCFNYFRQKRLVLPLGLSLGAGSLLATWLVAKFTTKNVDVSSYQGIFGLIVLLIGGFMVYDMTPSGQAKKKAGKEAVKAFEAAVKQKADLSAQGVKTIRMSITRIEMTFFGQEFSFNPILAFLGGIIISGISSFIGVGGGFLYVPFLTSLVGLPMFVAAGTSALAVLISMILSIFNFMMKGVTVHWTLIGIELIGVFVGSMIGPRTGKYIPEKALKIFFIILACYVGVGYTLRGFVGFRIPGV